ncbi:MAG: thioesterase family protein [Phenylobacterium sp.]|uniref:thioesterase family protein n=1 Tax=Phenylobacterium sp. TaxID=1871053 RepID=UPI003BB6DDE6
MTSLRSLLERVHEAEGGWVLDDAEGWTQGRTLFGGLTTALCAHVADKTLEALPPLRSAQVAFVGPAATPVSVEATELRRGRSATIVSVDCRAQTGLAARVLLTYGAPRDSRVAHDSSAAPKVAAPDDCEAFMPPREGPQGFFQKFDLRQAGVSRPMSGGPPEFLAWVRLKERDGVDPTLALLALADSLPPAAMAVFPAPAPISTMTWSIDIAHPVDPEGWSLLSSVSEQAQDGYSQQAMSLWDPAGRRLAVARQVVAIFA